MNFASHLFAITGVVSLMTGAPHAVAQAYPAKPIRLVVPAAVSTPIDILSRVVADRVGAELGQPLVIELRPGATGIVGAQEVLRQPADGYTIMTLHMPMSVAQSIYANVPFDLRKDFVPIGQTAWSSNVLVVHPSVKANSPKELEALLAAQPGKLNFSSGGPGTPAHVAGELFKIETHTDAVHVPYNQFPQAIADLLNGQNQFMFAAAPPMIPYINAGKLRALAVTGPQRLPALKEVPTMIEAGYRNFNVRDWQGFVAKVGTPATAIEKINAAIGAALQSEQVKAAFARLGADAAPGTPQDFGKLIDTEIARWATVTKQANIRVQ
jgi:tripartite-type tricarboxylate transporter receptor subunit TctC